MPQEKESNRGGRGFAGMDPAKQKEIASKGGKASHEKGTAHEFTPDEAREAGRKGGKAAHEKGTAHEFTPEEAREAGRKGGQASGRARAAAAAAQRGGTTNPASERQKEDAE
ncbi:MAG: KGG domain-containing protein [Pseudomonadota bacterium]|nr:KGG domain-containing protein [Pseudomonadota bacterium]